MRLATDHAAHLLLVVRDDSESIHAIDLTLALGARAPANMVDLLAELDALRPRIDLLATSADRAALRHMPIADLAAPLVPPSIWCIGLNYRAHSSEFAGEEVALPDAPIVFMKPATTITGPRATVSVSPAVTSEVDYEAELGVIIGRACRDVPASDARSVIAGYTAVNDLTARDLQRRHQQWILGKSLDGFCPIGPWIVTADDLGWPLDVRVSCTVNGELRQDAPTRDLIFDVACLVETLTAGRTLRPGDLIATGTPAGVGMGFDPPRFLHAGDDVGVMIEGIGRIETRIA